MSIKNSEVFYLSNHVLILSKLSHIVESCYSPLWTEMIKILVPSILNVLGKKDCMKQPWTALAKNLKKLREKPPWSSIFHKGTKSLIFKIAALSWELSPFLEQLSSCNHSGTTHVDVFSKMFALNLVSYSFLFKTLFCLFFELAFSVSKVFYIIC